MTSEREARTSVPARQAAYELRARTRKLAPSARERGCGALCVEHRDEEPSIDVQSVDGAPRASWRGLMTCGHIWTCPVCSQNLRAERAERISAAVRGMAGRWQMLTVTLRHRQGMPLKDLVAGLMKAWRRTRQGGRIQRVWGELVTGSARAIEVTWGENGWHPHVHVLLRTEDWTDDDRDALLVRWRTAIRRELGEHCEPNDEHGLTWSPPFEATDVGARAMYLAKLGLEVSGLGKSSSTTPWDIARRAADGDARCHWLWREFFAATRGRRMLELDDRASHAAELQLVADHAEDLAKEGEAESSRVTIPVKRDDVRALRRIERRIPAIFALVLRAAEERGGEGVADWLSYAREFAFAPAYARAGPHCPARAQSSRTNEALAA